MKDTNNDGKFKFEIVTPEAVHMLSRETRVTLPTTEGLITILPGHTQLAVQLTPGILRIYHGSDYNQENSTTIFINGGFANINQHECVIMAEESIPTKRLNIQELEQQKIALEEKLNSTLSSSEQDLIEDQLARLMTKITIAQEEHNT